MDLLDTHLDFLDTNMPSKAFVSLQDPLKTSSRHVFKTSSINIFKTCWRHVFKTSLRHVFKMSWNVFSITIFCLSRRLQDVFKTAWEISARRLGRRKIITLKTCWRRLQDISWRRLEDVLKISKCLLDKGMRVLFQKKDKKKGKKNVLKIQQSAKYLKIWAKMYKIWKTFENSTGDCVRLSQVIACDYRTQ